MKPSRWQSLAETLYDGPSINPPPRYREGIIAEVAGCLQSAYDEGKRDGESSSRERALREMLSIATGLQQDAERRRKDIERELAEYLRRIGKIPDV